MCVYVCVWFETRLLFFKFFRLNQNQPDAEPRKQEKVIEIESDIKLKI